MSSPLDGNGVAAWPPRDWQCPKCSYRSYCTFDADKGGPGNDLRCLNCKAVFRAPLAPSQTAVEPVALAQALKNLTEGAEQEDREILYAAASTLTAQAAALVAAEKERGEAWGDLSKVAGAIGSVRFMDPPDGGDVTLAEQVARMREALEAAESEVATLKARVAELEAGLAALLSVAEGAAEMASERSDWEQVAYRYGDAVLTARRLTHQEKNNGR